MSQPPFLCAYGRSFGATIGGPFKICVSTNPEARLRIIQDSCPYQVEKLCLIYAHSECIAKFVLASVRQDLADRHLRNEWFAASALEVAHAILINFREAFIDFGFTERQFYEFANAGSGSSDLLKQYAAAKAIAAEAQT